MVLPAGAAALTRAKALEKTRTQLCESTRLVNTTGRERQQPTHVTDTGEPPHAPSLAGSPVYLGERGERARRRSRAGAGPSEAYPASAVGSSDLCETEVDPSPTSRRPRRSPNRPSRSHQATDKPATGQQHPSRARPRRNAEPCHADLGSPRSPPSPPLACGAILPSPRAAQTETAGRRKKCMTGATTALRYTI